MNKEEKQKEIIDFIKNKYSNDEKLDKILNKVEEELELLSITDGLDDKNNLDEFYKIWKENINRTGTKNDINSWTSYFIGMTNCKPTGSFMPERRAFARAGFPDIDTDFDYEFRDDIYKYIIEKYGRENVGNIGTHGLLKFKSCVTRVTKALDLADSFHKGKDAFVTDNAAEVTKILSPFPKTSLMKINNGKESILIKNFKDAYEHCSDFKKIIDGYKNSKNIKRYIDDIEGTFANFGSHASGIVVSDRSLEQIAPLRTGKNGVIATQYPNEDLESLGLIKFDVLAIATLTVVRKTVEMIYDFYGIEIDIKNIPLSDNKTFELYRSGNLFGVFQCENYGMQRTMKDIKVDSFDDIVAALALYRPGPMDSIPDYCSRKNDGIPIDYFHKTIEPFVKPHIERTYGIIAYQEQIMQICSALAGFSVSDGYVMIKAIGKKKIHLMEKFKHQFIEGCVKNGVPKDVAKQYWEKTIIPFSGYGFNMSHSAAYAYNSYLTAYLKANYPDEFICSLLNVAITSGADKYEKVEAFEKEIIKKMKIKFLNKDVNFSKCNYNIERRKDEKSGISKTEIRPSLLCKGIGEIVAKEIEKGQPYKDMRDFVSRSKADIRSVEALASGGYFHMFYKGKISPEQIVLIVNDFKMIREDMKKLAKKGVESVDIFS